MKAVASNKPNIPGSLVAQASAMTCASAPATARNGSDRHKTAKRTVGSFIFKAATRSTFESIRILSGGTSRRFLSEASLRQRRLELQIDLHLRAEHVGVRLGIHLTRNNAVRDGDVLQLQYA